MLSVEDRKRKNMNSLWLTENKTRNYETLKKNISTDVCIVGAGIFGLSFSICSDKLSRKMVGFMLYLYWPLGQSIVACGGN